jgi:hypothetical protein
MGGERTVIGPTGAPINDLAALNTTLTTGGASGAALRFDNGTAEGEAATAFAATDFSVAQDPTAAELDTVIANCNQQVYNYVARQDIIDAINAQLAQDLADPPNFVAHQNAGDWAYINDNGYGLNAQALNLLVSAAWDRGNARHLTSNATGSLNGANYYIHIYADNRLYGIFQGGNHRGQWPTVTVVAVGSVNAGRHEF